MNPWPWAGVGETHSRMGGQRGRLTARTLLFCTEIRGGETRLEWQCGQQWHPSLLGAVPMVQASGMTVQGHAGPPGSPLGQRPCFSHSSTGQRTVEPEDSRPHSRVPSLCPPTVKAVVFIEENHQSEGRGNNFQSLGGQMWAAVSRGGCRCVSGGTRDPRADCVSRDQRGSGQVLRRRGGRRRCPRGRYLLLGK